MRIYVHWSEVTDWPWPHFSPEEMACKGTGSLGVEPDFMDRLERLRVAYDRPMILSSAYRSPAHNKLVSKTGETGPHTTARAVDTLVFGYAAFKLEALAYEHGFTGLGQKQNGQHGDRFLHLDDLQDAPGCPRPWIWSY